MTIEVSNIVDLKVKKRAPPKSGNHLEIVSDWSCPHKRLEVDEKLAEVTCRDCKAKLNPIWALKSLCDAEHGMWERYRTMRAIAMELEKRTKTKCECCGKMTRIRSGLSQHKIWEIADQMEKSGDL